MRCVISYVNAREHGRFPTSCAMLVNKMVIRRILICFLLCLAVPVQGFASIAVSACTCPMSHHAAMEDSSESSTMPDCCKHDDKYSQTCKDCNGGQQCHPSTSWQYFSSAQVIQVPTIEQPVWASRVAQFIPSFDPSSVWRPPALF